VIFGGLVGALAGSQYGSVREAYEEVLEADIKQKEVVIDYIKDNRKKYADKETYKATLEEIQGEYSAAKEKLAKYESLEDGDQKKEALTDFKNYGLTIKNLEVGLNPDSFKGAKKGAVAGAVGGVVLLSAAGAMRRKKKKENKYDRRSGLGKEEMKQRSRYNKNLERRLSVFLSLLVGGVGLSLVFPNFSGIVTGNVIRSEAYSTSGILGIVFLVVGCVGTYFYFKE